jgi:hypothetical protein
MERDPKLSKLIRESGVVPAPGDFTARVMAGIDAIPGTKSYKPLIGRGGRMIILLAVIGIIVLSVVYSDPGGGMILSGDKLSQLNWQLPSPTFRLDFLQQINISTGIVSALVAMFFLVLTDSLISRRRLT